MKEEKASISIQSGGLEFSVTRHMNPILTAVLSIHARPELESQICSFVAEALETSYSGSVTLCLLSYESGVRMPSAENYSDRLETQETK